MLEEGLGRQDGGMVGPARSWGEGTGSPAQSWWTPPAHPSPSLPLSHSWALKPTPKPQTVCCLFLLRILGTELLVKQPKREQCPERGAGPLSLKQTVESSH